MTRAAWWGLSGSLKIEGAFQNVQGISPPPCVPYRPLDLLHRLAVVADDLSGMFNIDLLLFLLCNLCENLLSKLTLPKLPTASSRKEKAKTQIESQ